MNDTSIERATAGDAPAVVRLIAQLRELEGLTEPVSADAVRAYIEDPDTVVLLAEDEESGEVVGLLSLRVMADLFHGGTTALVQELVVDEDHRGTGIGGALLDVAVELAFDQGCLEVSVTTGEENEAGQALYRSRGFEQDGVYFELHADG